MCIGGIDGAMSASRSHHAHGRLCNMRFLAAGCFLAAGLAVQGGFLTHELLLPEAGLVIFFSLTEAPLPDPTPTPPKDLKGTRNRPETEPNGAKRTRTEANGAEMDRNQDLSGGTAGGFVGMGGGGWGL